MRKALTIYLFRAVTIVALFLLPHILNTWAPPAYAQGTVYSIHLSSYRDISGAHKEISKLKELGYEAPGGQGVSASGDAMDFSGFSFSFSLAYFF